MQRYDTRRNARYDTEKQEDHKELRLHIGERDKSEHIHDLRAACTCGFGNVVIKSEIGKERNGCGKSSDRDSFYNKGRDYVCLGSSDKAHYADLVSSAVNRKLYRIEDHEHADGKEKNEEPDKDEGKSALEILDGCGVVNAVVDLHNAAYLEKIVFELICPRGVLIGNDEGIGKGVVSAFRDRVKEILVIRIGFLHGFKSRFLGDIIDVGYVIKSLDVLGYDLKLLGSGVVIDENHDLIEESELFNVYVNISYEESESSEEYQTRCQHEHGSNSRGSVSPEIAERVKDKVEGIVDSSLLGILTHRSVLLPLPQRTED